MIDFLNVRKLFGTQTVLEGVSFRIHPGERVGVVGPNGAGKSTVAALITGEQQPDKGEVALPKNLRCGYLHQQLNAHAVDSTLLDYTENALPELLVMQHEIHEIEADLHHLPPEEKEYRLKRLGRLQTDFEHAGGYELKHRAQEALSGLGFSIGIFSQPFRDLSGGWQMRAELARTLISRPDLLVLDEPTNFLDMPAVEWLRDYLRDFPGTLLLISHDRYLLNSLTTTTLEVVGAKVSRYAGNYDYYIRERRLRREQLLAAKGNQDRKREQMERFIERFRAKNTKSSQAQSRMKMLERMEDVEVPEDFVQPPRIRLAQPPHCGEESFRLEDAGLSYDGSRWVWRHVDLRLERGEKVAVAGFNGMGKTTLLRVLAGRLKLSEGRCVLGHQVLPGYFAQEFTENMNPDRTVFEIARQANQDRPEKELRAILGSFRFSGDAIDKPVAVLSGGEKSRLALCRLLLQPCNFLVLDEPTSHLDIASREVLEEALQQYTGTLILVSHDVEFVRHVATTIFAIEPPGITRYFGNYDYYRQKLAEAKARATGETRESTAAPSAGEERKNRKREEARLRQELYRKRKPLEDKLAAAEKAVDRLHAEQQELLAKMQTPGVNFAEINRRLGEIHAETTTATTAWEETALALEEIMTETPANDETEG